jgi:hypothetical protein
MAMLLIGFLSWFIVESLWDTTISGITTFGVFCLKVYGLGYKA